MSSSKTNAHNSQIKAFSDKSSDKKNEATSQLKNYVQSLAHQRNIEMLQNLYGDIKKKLDLTDHKFNTEQAALPAFAMGLESKQEYQEHFIPEIMDHQYSFFNKNDDSKKLKSLICTCIHTETYTGIQLLHHRKDDVKSASELPASVSANRYVGG